MFLSWSPAVAVWRSMSGRATQHSYCSRHLAAHRSRAATRANIHATAVQTVVPSPTIGPRSWRFGDYLSHCSGRPIYSTYQRDPPTTTAGFAHFLQRCFCPFNARSHRFSADPRWRRLGERESDWQRRAYLRHCPAAIRGKTIHVARTRRPTTVTMATALEGASPGNRHVVWHRRLAGVIAGPGSQVYSNLSRTGPSPSALVQAALPTCSTRAESGRAERC